MKNLTSPVKFELGGGYFQIPSDMYSSPRYYKHRSAVEAPYPEQPRICSEKGKVWDNYTVTPANKFRPGVTICSLISHVPTK